MTFAWVLNRDSIGRDLDFVSCHELFRQNEICAVPEKAAALINVASSFFCFSQCTKRLYADF